jgi:hypothetical protein
VKPPSHPFSGAHAARPALGTCPLPVFSLHRGDALRVRGGGGGQRAGHCFLFFRHASPLATPTPTCAPATRCASATRCRAAHMLQRRLARERCGGEVQGYGGKLHSDPRRTACAPHVMPCHCLAKGRATWPKRALQMARACVRGYPMHAWPVLVIRVILVRFKNDVIRTRLLVWRARRLISR